MLRECDVKRKEYEAKAKVVKILFINLGALVLFTIVMDMLNPAVAGCFIILLALNLYSIWLQFKSMEIL